MLVDGATIPVTLGFVPDSVAVDDVDRPGLRRAGPRAAAPYSRDHVDRHVVAATDTARDDATRPNLLEFGFDTVDLSNLQRQLLHQTEDVGKTKMQSAIETLNAYNPHVTVVPHEAPITSHNAMEIIRDYDYVVMGTRGREGLSRWLRGSVAEKVMRQAPCAVMTVRSREAEPKRAPSNSSADLSVV